jgi:hypothetical protein
VRIRLKLNNEQILWYICVVDYNQLYLTTDEITSFVVCFLRREPNYDCSVMIVDQTFPGSDTPLFLYLEYLSGATD